VGEFDKLKDDAEQYAQQHPEQVKEGEQAAEKELGIHGQPAQAGHDTDSGNGTDQDSAGHRQQNA
jgi:hypothetical protein